MKNYAPVRCNVTIMYATSSTNDSSLLAEAYFVASVQKLLFGFSSISNVSNSNHWTLDLIIFALNQFLPIAKTDTLNIDYS